MTTYKSYWSHTGYEVYYTGSINTQCNYIQCITPSLLRITPIYLFADCIEVILGTDGDTPDACTVDIAKVAQSEVER